MYEATDLTVSGMSRDMGLCYGGHSMGYSITAKYHSCTGYAHIGIGPCLYGIWPYSTGPYIHRPFKEVVLPLYARAYINLSSAIRSEAWPNPVGCLVDMLYMACPPQQSVVNDT